MQIMYKVRDAEYERAVYFKKVYGLCYLKLFRIILQILFYLNLAIIEEVSLSSSYYLIVRYNLKYMPRLLVIELHG